MTGILTRIFTFFSESSAKAATPLVPKPDHIWCIPVDGQGNIIKDRAPQAGDFMARRPVSYHFGGSVPTYVPDSRKRKPEQMAELVAYQLSEKNFREKLDRAVFDLSQTPDGRRLLELAHREGFAIVKDDRTLDARGALGLADYKNKIIPIHSKSSPTEMSLTLKHELQHMEDIKNGAGYSTSDRFVDALVHSRAMEASARVSEAVYAYEARVGDPKGPAWQYRPPGVWDKFAHKLPEMSKAARSYLEGSRAVSLDQFAAAVFPAFYRERPTLASYDEDMISSFSKIITPIPVPLPPERYMDPEIRRYQRNLPHIFMYRETADHRSKLASCLTIAGKPFLHLSDFDPTSGAAGALLECSMPKFQKLAEAVKTIWPNNTPPPLDVPVYETYKDAEPERKKSGFFKKSPRARTLPAGVPLIVQPDKFEVYTLPKPERYETHADLLKAIIDVPGYMARDPVSAIGFALDDFSGRMGRGGQIDDLVRAGLRVPIMALPESYIERIMVNLDASSGKKFDAHKDAFGGLPEPQLALCRHWQEMARRGIDPYTGNIKNPERERFFEWTAAGIWGKELSKCFPRGAEAPPPEMPNMQAIARERLANLPKPKPQEHYLCVTAPTRKN